MVPVEILINKVLSALQAHLTKKAFFFSAYYSSNTLMLKRFFKPELNRLNAFVKTATNALMLDIKSRNKKFYGA